MKSKRFRIGLTVAVVLLAAGAVFLKYRHYVFNPWTRDGQVRAQVIQRTPRVTGTLVHLAVNDNQKVKKGDLLFEIDPRTFAAKLRVGTTASVLVRKGTKGKDSGDSVPTVPRALQ